jgi:hypothetical protein
VSGIFSVAAGLLATAAGVFLGAFMLDVFLLVLRSAIGPAEPGARSVGPREAEPKRRPYMGTSVQDPHSGQLVAAHHGDRRGPSFLPLN